MKLIPHHQDDKHGPREYRSPDGTWRVLRTRRPGGGRNARPRWEVHERCEGRGAAWRHHAAFERRRDALVFLDTTAAASGGESVTTAPARRRETPEPSQEPPQSSPRRTPKGPITHNLDETRSQDIPWSLCGVLLYDPRQIPKEGEPATCGKCQRFRSAASLPETPSGDEGGEEGDLNRTPGGPSRGPETGKDPRLHRPRRRGTDRAW